MFEALPISSPVKGSSGMERGSSPPSEGISEVPSGPPTFVPAWNLNNESRLSVHTNVIEFA